MTAAPLPLDASAREAEKNAAAAQDTALSGDEFTFVTRGVSDIEKAAIVTVLTHVRGEEQRRMLRAERRPLQPWQRSQRLPARILETYFDA